MQRQYNYGKTFKRKDQICTKVCKRCEQSFTFISVQGLSSQRKYCPPCVPLAEQERHKASERKRRAQARLNGWPTGHNKKKPKLIPYAGYDDGVVE